MTQITQSEQGATGRFINMGSPAALDDLGPVTVIAYCSFPALPTVLPYIFGKAAGTGWSRFLVVTDGSLLYGKDSSSLTLSPERRSDAGAVNVAGVAQHLQFDYDGTLLAAGINLYIDAGAAIVGGINSSNGVGTLTSDAPGDLFLMNRAGLGREFVGKLFYIAKWNRILTSGERATARTSGPLAVPTGLVLCYANGQDYSTFAHPVVARSAFVDGGLPPNTTLGPATAVSLTGAAPVEDLAAGGTFVAAGSPVSFTGSAPVEDLSAAGTFATGAAVSFTGAAAVEDIGAAGSFVASTAGTFTSEAIYNNVGGTITLAASVGADYFDLIHATNLTTVVRKTGLSTNASGIVTFADAAVFPGVLYRVDFKLANGTRIMPVKAAT